MQSKYLGTYTLSSIHIPHVSKVFTAARPSCFGLCLPTEPTQQLEEKLLKCRFPIVVFQRVEPTMICVSEGDWSVPVPEGTIMATDQPGYLHFSWKPCNLFKSVFLTYTHISTFPTVFVWQCRDQAVSFLFTLVSTHNCPQRAHIWAGVRLSIRVSLGTLS